MGKKRVSALGSENEEQVRQKAAVKREQKKMREGKVEVKEAPKAELVEEKPAKSVKRLHKRSNHYQTIKKETDVNKNYSLTEGIKLLRKVSDIKFDATVELHINCREKGLTKELELPHSTGKVRRIATATDKTIEKIEKGQIDFDVLLASAEQMGKLVKFAKILGPKGLMPNPKNGTVVPDPEKTAKTMAGKNSLILKTEKDAPLIHIVVGKLSMPDKQLAENITAVTTALSGKIAKTVLKSTMSPAIKLVL